MGLSVWNHQDTLNSSSVRCVTAHVTYVNQGSPLETAPRAPAGGRSPRHPLPGTTSRVPEAGQVFSINQNLNSLCTKGHHHSGIRGGGSPPETQVPRHPPRPALQADPSEGPVWGLLCELFLLGCSLALPGRGACEGAPEPGCGADPRPWCASPWNPAVGQRSWRPSLTQPACAGRAGFVCCVS